MGRKRKNKNKKKEQGKHQRINIRRSIKKGGLEGINNRRGVGEEKGRDPPIAVGGLRAVMQNENGLPPL